MKIPHRREIKDYSSACERLIAASLSVEAIPFTQDEIDWISYYATEMTNLVDQLARKSKTQILHDRPTIQEFVVTSEALFMTDSLSEEEKQSICESVADVTTKILGEKDDPPATSA